MRTPVHVWIVGLLSVLWNAGGAYDYLMIQTENAGYLGMMSPEQLAFMQGAPLWFDAGWAIGVWGSVLGALLILLRIRYAFHTFVLSLLGMAVNSTYGYLIAEPGSLELSGTTGLVFSALIVVVLIFEIFYVRAMTIRGVFR